MLTSNGKTVCVLHWSSVATPEPIDLCRMSSLISLPPFLSFLSCPNKIKAKMPQKYCIFKKKTWLESSCTCLRTPVLLPYLSFCWTDTTETNSVLNKTFSYTTVVFSSSLQILLLLAILSRVATRPSAIYATRSPTGTLGLQWPQIHLWTGVFLLCNGKWCI